MDAEDDKDAADLAFQTVVTNQDYTDAVAWLDRAGPALEAARKAEEDAI